MKDSHHYQLPDGSLPILNVSYDPKTEARDTGPHAEPPETRIGNTTPEPYVALIGQYQAESHERYALEKERIALEKAKEVRDRKKLYLEWAVFACVVVTAAFTIFQWWAMYDTLLEVRKQTPAMIQAADVARDSLNEAQMATDIAELQAKKVLQQTIDGFRIDQRPYLTVGTPTFTTAPSIGQRETAVNLTISNIGKTPAIDHRVFGRMERYRTTTAPNYRDALFAFLERNFADINAQARDRTEKYSRYARRDVAPEAKPFTSFFYKEQWTSDDIAALGSGSLVLYVVGVVTYSDAFSGRYETEFCSVYFGKDTRIWHICDSHNIIR